MRKHATKTSYLALGVLLAGTTFAVGCGSATDTPADASPAAANIDASQFRLAEEPDGAIGVIAARESTDDGAPLVLVGRVGGSAQPWVEGRAAFTLLDASMSVVAEGKDSTDGEMCLGDCCATERAGCTTLVKVVDEQGKLVKMDSRQLLGLQESDMVVVEGNAQKDKTGNFVMLAKGVFVRK